MVSINLPAITEAAVLLAFVTLVFWAAVSDILKFVVPNRVCLAIALLYPAYVLSASQPIPWPAALAIAGTALVLGFVLFALGGWGGGDAKLFAAVALWAGPDTVVMFTFLTTMAGGIMAVYIWVQQRLARVSVTAMLLQTDIDPQAWKAPMPYGAAIAIGALYVAFTLLKVS